MLLLIVTLRKEDKTCNRNVQMCASLTMKYCQITGTYSKNIPLTINDAMANGSDKPVKFMTGGMARLFCSTTVIKKTVILTRQFRFPVFINGHQGDLIEAAAGLLDNMDPESRIKAEAEEETGFKVSSVQKIFEAYMSPGSVTEKLYFYLAEYQPKDKTSAGGGIKAEGEDIDVLELPFEDALRGIETGMIVDGKTIMLLYHVALKGIL